MPNRHPTVCSTDRNITLFPLGKISQCDLGVTRVWQCYALDKVNKAKYELGTTF